MVGTTGIDCELPWNPKFSNIADIQLEGKLANRQIVVPIRKKEIPTAGLTCLHLSVVWHWELLWLEQIIYGFR